MTTFDINTHYWVVASDANRVFSAVDRSYVALSNAAYQRFLQDGRVPTRIGTEAELWDVLAKLAPAVALQVPAALDRMKDLAVSNIENGTSLGVLFKVLRNINNRVRVLEGQQPLTVEQTRAALRTLL